MCAVLNMAVFCSSIIIIIIIIIIIKQFSLSLPYGESFKGQY